MNSSGPARSRSTVDSNAESRRAALLHLMCHDLRVPLTSLMAYAELLGDSALSAEQHDTFVAAIRVQSRRLSRMVDDLESLAHDGAAESDGFPAMNIGERLTDAAVEIQKEAGERGVQVEVDLRDPHLWAAGDGDSLGRALVWLLEAALRRVPRGGKIVLRSERSGDEVLAEMILPGGLLSGRESESLGRFTTGAAVPDLVRGIAGPFTLSLEALRATGAKIETVSEPGSFRWVCRMAEVAPR